MEQHLNVLSQALNKANQAGAFNLQESAIVAQALGAVIQALTPSKPNPIEVARAEAKAQHSGDGNKDIVFVSKEQPISEEVISEEPNGSNKDEEVTEKK